MKEGWVQTEKETEIHKQESGKKKNEILLSRITIKPRTQKNS